MKRSFLVPVLLAAAVLAGCGSAPEELRPPLGEDTLPTLTARDRALPTDALAADAFDPDALAALLERAGYRDGRERELSGRTETLDHVVARVLRFRDAAGADLYLDWVAGHTGELVGPMRVVAPLPTGERALLYELVPCATCKKELPTLLAVWRQRSLVGSVLASGRGADRTTLAPLVHEADAAVRLRESGQVR